MTLAFKLPTMPKDEVASQPLESNNPCCIDDGVITLHKQ
jgi:hypothetical protein